jgi:hypothetical protein
MNDYYELSHLKAVKSLLLNEETFLNTLQNLDFVGIVNIFDAI